MFLSRAVQRFDDVRRPSDAARDAIAQSTDPLENSELLFDLMLPSGPAGGGGCLVQPFFRCHACLPRRGQRPVRLIAIDSTISRRSSHRLMRRTYSASYLNFF